MRKYALNLKRHGRFKEGKEHRWEMMNVHLPTTGGQIEIQD